MDGLRQYFTDNPVSDRTSFSTLVTQSGKPDQDIVNYAQNAQADLLILFRSKKSLLRRLFEQSVTKNVVLSTRVPVLILKE